MGRDGSPAEIADVVWYLSTPGASYVTGATIDVNGGRFIG
jgi:3-oxoacyl-[acyl-carrier protein] reductase